MGSEVNKRNIMVGVLLSQLSQSHLSLTQTMKLCESMPLEFIFIDPKVPIQNYPKFDIILHKASDYLKAKSKNIDFAVKILEGLKAYQLINAKIIFLDPLTTVLGLADRKTMYEIMEKCIFQYNGINIKVPKWTPLEKSEDIEKLKSSNFKFPIICKAICAGEGEGAHDMQLLFNSKQLNNLTVFPSIAQEFENHGGYLVKIFIMGKYYFTTTRPSVKDFPIDAESLNNIETIRFMSHDVVKLTSFGFLNNFQKEFTLKSSVEGDEILNDEVIKELIHILSKNIKFYFLGIDILLSDNGKTYNLVDINNMPSYDGIANREKLLFEIFQDIVQRGNFVEYWGNNSIKN